MKFKKILLATLSAVVMIAGLNTASLAETKIVYANYLGLKHPTNPALERFFKRVTDQTKGEVKWEGHFASSLLGPKDIPAGVRDGVADAGYFVGVYVPSEMPLDNYVGDFAFINDDALVMTGVLNELVLLNCEECDNEYRNGFKTQYLGTYALTEYFLQCKKEYRSLADFKNKKIRGFAGWTAMIKAMGAVPVSISANEMYEALERGTIDCATHSITNQRTRSLGEVAHNVVMNSLGGFMGASLMNMRLDKWKALTPEQRTVILKNIPKLVTDSAMNYINLDIEVRKEMEAKGNKFYKGDKDLADFIVKFRADYLKNTAPKKGAKRGVKNPEKIAKEIHRLRDKWVALLKKHGRDQKTFEKLLWDEIYSKVPVKG